MKIVVQHQHDGCKIQLGESEQSEYIFRSQETINQMHGFNPLTPMNDRISPYNINTISSRQLRRRKKNIS